MRRQLSEQNGRCGLPSHGAGTRQVGQVTRDIGSDRTGLAQMLSTRALRRHRAGDLRLTVGGGSRKVSPSFAFTDEPRQETRQMDGNVARTSRVSRLALLALIALMLLAVVPAVAQAAAGGEASLKIQAYPVYAIPLKAGMSIGMLLISVELFLMLCILLFIPGDYAGPCFIGFAIGESLGAAALRIAGGIFTKIADIGSDLMKIVFKIKEDDARNPGVIADCTGDNAGDSVGPSADGFETYGVTGVALITFILLGVKDPTVQVQLLVWIFVMRIAMLVASAAAYFINSAIAKARYANVDKMNFETPLTTLVWLTSIISILMTYAISAVIVPV